MGFDEELITFLVESDNYLSDEQLVLEFLEKKGEEEFYDEEFTTWEEAFKKLGFTEVKAEILGDLADENPFSSHETPVQWASRHIEQELKYNILLSPVQNKNSCNTTGDFDVEYDIIEEDSGVIICKAIDKLKLRKEKLPLDRFFTDFLVQKKDTMKGVTFWFHGTDRESALNIVTEGIYVNFGGKGLDFSHGDGFYLTR